MLIAGLRISGWIAALVRKQALKRENIDDTLGSFFASITRWFLTAATIIAALQLFGVQATSFVAILGAMTLAIGLSLQGALGNIAPASWSCCSAPTALDNMSSWLVKAAP